MEEDVEGLKRRIDVFLEEIWTTIADTRPEKFWLWEDVSARRRFYEFVYPETSEYCRISIV